MALFHAGLKAGATEVLQIPFISQRGNLETTLHFFAAEVP